MVNGVAAGSDFRFVDSTMQQIPAERGVVCPLQLSGQRAGRQVRAPRQEGHGDGLIQILIDPGE